MKLSGAEVIIKYLEAEGIEHIFGIPGGHLLPFYDAIYKSEKIEPVLTRHESSAAFMASGYAMVSGKLGVCCGTVGPGATNLVSGVAAAYMDSIPMLVITAQVGTSTFGKGGLQESTGWGHSFNQVSLMTSVCKHSYQITQGKRIVDTVRAALQRAKEGRPGPVHLDMPADILKCEIEVESILPVNAPHSPGNPDQEKIEEIVSHLINAEKAGLLVGWGACSAKAAEEVLRVAEKYQIPVATTLRAKGVIPEDHELSLGCLGLYGTNAANGYFRSDLDVLLAVGCSFHEFSTHCWDPALTPKKALIQIDIDPNEIGKNYPVTIGINGDAKEVLRNILSFSKEGVSSKPGEDLDKFRTKHDYFSEPERDSDSTPVKPQRLMSELSKYMPRDAIVFADIGNSLAWAERHLMSTNPYSFYTLSGLAAMGSSVAGIGAKIARPDKTIIILCGDGGFQMTGMEVSTAVNLGLSVVWIVLNNSRLGMIHDVQTVSYQQRYIASTFTPPDFAKMAHAFGAQGHHVENPSDLAAAFEAAFSSNQPTVIDVIIDPEEKPPLRPRMLAIRRSMGLPDLTESVSWKGFKAMFGMIKEE